MSELIKMVVVTSDGDSELQFEQSGDVVDVTQDGKHIFACDWSGNLRKAIRRMLEIWD